MRKKMLRNLFKKKNPVNVDWITDNSYIEYDSTFEPKKWDTGLHYIEIHGCSWTFSIEQIKKLNTFAELLNEGEFES